MNLLYINGLNPAGGVKQSELQVLASLEEQGIVAEAADVNHRLDGSFEDITDRLEARVRELAELGDVAIVGFSAGGSYAMNVFDRVRDLDNVTATSIAGRLQVGNYRNAHPYSLYQAAHLGSSKGPHYPNFHESVRYFDNVVRPRLTEADKKRLLVIRPKFDQVVPVKTMTVPGVETEVVRAITHQTARNKGLRVVAARLAA